MPAHIPSGDWPTFDYTASRAGVYPGRTGLTAGDLGRLRLRTVAVNGVVDSAPIELHAVKVSGRRRDVVIVTTSYGKTVAIDPGRGKRLWEFVPRGVNATPGNYQVTTSGPVADPDRRYVYTASPNGVIHKLSVGSGHQVWQRRVSFDPRHEKLASALNISGRSVVVVSGGYYGDALPYDGHVAMISRGTGRITRVWNAQCSNRHRLIHAGTCPTTRGSAIWARAGTVIVPGSRRILTATGNGAFDGHTGWGDSALELTASASRLLHNWTPTDEAQLDQTDTDLGSTIPALLPVYHRLRLAVQGGKDGRLHLLNLARLNGTPGSAGPRLGGELSEVASPGGGEVFTAPVATRIAGRILIFVADDAGTSAYTLRGGRHPALHVVWQDATAGTSPVLAGGLLYVYDEQDGRLVIRAAASGRILRTLAVSGGHWNSPIVVAGRIIEPTGNYHSSAGSSLVYIYHLPGR
ncbi:MAG: PQQ-binding-like beta-propeller repeat protein [Actinomycetota bacterium]|nr:PQQ-binding-like beta-propeller repeat protein [Actinomycetota bacterium]